MRRIKVHDCHTVRSDFLQEIQLGSKGTEWSITLLVQTINHSPTQQQELPSSRQASPLPLHRVELMGFYPQRGQNQHQQREDCTGQSRYHHPSNQVPDGWREGGTFTNQWR
ncbi:uncharacterized protein LOC142353888 [Convolutriloba macropyga]|uniref:uncharacterized protein LOC142353888 n=1 Tax=Convolutriloba macropyga TaxID=536237 RepID=UPI003F527492